MSVEVLKASSEKAWLAMRKHDVTSTEIAALFGVSSYLTEFELYHRHSSGFQVEQDNTFTSWGQRLQWPIAQGIAKDNGWKVKTLSRVYLRDTEERRGASYDYEIEIPGEGKGFLEVKNVFGMKYKDEWIKGEDGEVEAPASIELQVQQQVDLASRGLGYSFGIIGALVGGNQIVTLKRTPKDNIITAIRKKVGHFWERVQTNNPPNPVFEVDHEFIAKLYLGSQEGKVMNLEADMELVDLAKEYTLAGSLESEASTRKKAAKAAMLMKIGDAEKALGTGFRITAGTVGPADVSYQRQPYRNFRLTWSKGMEPVS